MIGSFSPRGCDRARAQVSALLDGALSELEEADLRLHLDGCAACRTFQAGAVSISGSLRAAPLEQLDFPIVVPNRRYVATRWIQGASAAAVVLVAIGLGSSQGLLAGRGGAGSTSSSSSSGRASSASAYLQSPDYERRLLNSLRTPHRGRTGGAIPQ
ncbi:MAG: zf-HC2 domain-containing protein [Actinomycetota bacterium]|nr:zf-HC2 domain-containing protein [Actinomycetota bacterium]